MTKYTPNDETLFWRAVFCAAISGHPYVPIGNWDPSTVADDSARIADAAVAEAKKRGRLG